MGHKPLHAKGHTCYCGLFCGSHVEEYKYVVYLTA